MKMENGELKPLTPEENAVRDRDEAEWADSQKNASVLTQIKALEAQMTPRRIREAFADPTLVNNLNSQIAALRAQLV